MLKRSFDIVGSICIFFFLLIPFVFIWIVSAVDTKSSGIFLQKRVGQYGEIFLIFKLRSIQNNNSISKYGAFIRKYKLDELPQLLNVIIGNMSFVGPRPDVIGYYNKLEGDQRLILNLKPGLTSEAAIKYFNEEELLKNKVDPLTFNDEIIFPDKVEMNLKYYYNNSFLGDLKIIWKTTLIVFNRNLLDKVI